MCLSTHQSLTWREHSNAKGMHNPLLRWHRRNQWFCSETNGSQFSWPVPQDNMALGYRTNSQDEVQRSPIFFPVSITRHIKEWFKDVVIGRKEDCHCWCHFTDGGHLDIFRIWTIESWCLWTKAEVRKLGLWEGPDSKNSRLAIIDLCGGYSIMYIKGPDRIPI